MTLNIRKSAAVPTSAIVLTSIVVIATGCGEPGPVDSRGHESSAIAPLSLDLAAEPVATEDAATSMPPTSSAIDLATAERPVNESGDAMSDLELLNEILFNYNEARATGATSGNQLRKYKTEAEEVAAMAAQQQTQGPVKDLSELVAAGLIRAVPAAPAGQKYAIDPKTHKAVLVSTP